MCGIALGRITLKNFSLLGGSLGAFEFLFCSVMAQQHSRKEMKIILSSSINIGVPVVVVFFQV